MNSLWLGKSGLKKFIDDFFKKSSSFLSVLIPTAVGDRRGGEEESRSKSWRKRRPKGFGVKSKRLPLPSVVADIWTGKGSNRSKGGRIEWVMSGLEALEKRTKWTNYRWWIGFLRRFGWRKGFLERTSIRQSTLKSCDGNGNFEIVSAVAFGLWKPGKEWTEWSKEFQNPLNWHLNDHNLWVYDRRRWLKIKQIIPRDWSMDFWCGIYFCKKTKISTSGKLPIPRNHIFW